MINALFIAVVAVAAGVLILVVVLNPRPTTLLVVTPTNLLLLLVKTRQRGRTPAVQEKLRSSRNKQGEGQDFGSKEQKNGNYFHLQ